MKKIRIAQIGTSRNSHGNDIFKTLKKENDIFEIVGYAFPENERMKFPENMEMFEGYQELALNEILNDPTIEAVTVETEECYLTKYAQMAASAGKHIHMEKPGGTDLTAFEKLIETVRKKEVVFHIGYMYRYNPLIKQLLEEIQRGDLGEILCVEAQMNCNHTKELKDWLKNYQGGSLFFLGCHLIDLILQIQGTPERVIPLSRSTGLEEVTAEDFGMVVFEYPKGISFAKVNSNEIGGFARRQFVVTGSKKTVEIKPLEMWQSDGVFTEKTEYGESNWLDRGQHQKTEVYGRYTAMLRAFAQMVNGNVENPYTYDYELELYRMILKCCGY